MPGSERQSRNTAGAGMAAVHKWARVFKGWCFAPYTRVHQITGVVMPKMKTKKSASKRFVVRPGGTIKRGQAFKRHILTKKSTKVKRQLRGSTSVHKADTNSIRAMMPFA
jgi:large subunit ribosomal protein L35